MKALCSASDLTPEVDGGCHGAFLRLGQDPYLQRWKRVCGLSSTCALTGFST